MFSVMCRLGRDAELRYTASSQPVTNLAVAYDYGQRGQDGNRPTQWVDCTLWGDQGVKLREYLTKGTVLHLALRDVHTETFTRRDNTIGHKLVATVMHLEFAPRQRDRDGAPPAAAPAPAPAAAAPAPADPYAPKAPPPRPPAGAPAGDAGFDDDIPF